MIPQSFIEELKMNCDIESVVSSYVQLRKRGRISTGLCPFHSEKSGSFTVYPESERLPKNSFLFLKQNIRF